ncbi:MAG: fatty acid desaturase [Deltaproteobacteria bacterium]|nr:fatty acid desaturase [Deltaproteobacteria bacterium]
METQVNRNAEVGDGKPPIPQLPKAKLKALSAVSPARSAAKLFLYFGALITFGVAIELSPSWPVQLGFQLLMGLLFAHGLELQHELLHRNMLRSSRLSRLFGVLVGAPMLVSFTHYKIQHLHHHRKVGTDQDAEIFGYDASQLTTVPGFVARAWNLSRIPAFALTLIGIAQNSYPELATSKRLKSNLRTEYLLLGALATAGAVAVIQLQATTILNVWFVPWLVFGELFHFLIELPEHIGCDRSDPNPLRNTRSYKTTAFWSYVANGNNFHIEHHLWPSIAIHNLREAHRYISEARAEHIETSLRAALASVWRATRRSNKELHQS